jgi:hypothetical protein
METVKERRRAKLLVQLVELEEQKHRERVEHCLKRWTETTPPCTGGNNGVEK